MTLVRRISITAYSGLALAIVATGLQRSGGILYPNAWLVALAGVTVLAVVGVFFVNRWWSLVPALTTVAAFYSAGATESPEGAEAFGEFISSEFAVPFLFGPIVFGIVVLSVGLVARAIWEHLIRPSASSAERAGSE